MPEICCGGKCKRGKMQLELQSAREEMQRLSSRIAHQRQEIKNRLIEIHGLMQFKRNIEREVFLATSEEFKHRPLGGIEHLTSERDAARETIAELVEALAHSPCSDPPICRTINGPQCARCAALVRATAPKESEGR